MFVHRLALAIALLAVLPAVRIRAYPAACQPDGRIFWVGEDAMLPTPPISAADFCGAIDPCKRWPLATASGGLRR